MNKRYTPKHAGPKSVAYIQSEAEAHQIALAGGTTDRVGKHHFPHADVVIKTQEAQHRAYANRLNPTATVPVFADAA